MNLNICPYPGLRPFNEEESIFFKGREQQVERLVKRLEEKKFLMVNGASGDGKSSLIYAGVIPYAKAGFFKAKYNNWIVADFRPERSPLKNLTASICKQLKIEDDLKTEKELGYGFSALCDLYKSSAFYIDESKAEWLNADDKEKKVLKRKGANLLVLVDQFEEFFTNPENYQNGIPSIESQKTVNLLLETYKLAAAQDLPIYVVCTMRSDYIGQCAAFRGLPEAVGYSQFFVPRLKRQEIEQVIEGPAELAGCKISKRLTQTLLNSLTDGFDQLPILQHALNQIWKAASDGAEEMDLIHLVKVGGLSSKMLSIDDKNTFQKWFENLPEYKKQLLATPSLSNVLNAHANELLYHDNQGLLTLKNFEESRNVKVIKVLFQSLTAFDKGRIIRRRASVGEVMELLNDATLSLNEFNKIILKFREEGNSFIKPYLNESIEVLDKNVVLDITHESLIRNWKLVEQWVMEEVENVQTWLEIEKPLDVWKKNVKPSSEFVFLFWSFYKEQKYTLSSGLYILYYNWQKKFPVNLPWLQRISTKYNQTHIVSLNHFLKRSNQVRIWNKFIPYTIAFLAIALIFFIYAVNIKDAKVAIKNQKIQKELVLKAERNAKLALQAKGEAELAKQEADSLKNIAIQNEVKVKKELEYIIENSSPIVMPGKMNIMYVGVENPFDFAVSGFNVKDIEPTIELFPEEARNSKYSLKKRTDGSYTLKIPKGVKGVKINALAKIGNERKILKGDAPYFRVKSLPEPVAYFVGFDPNQFNFNEEDIPKLSELSVIFKNFDFNVKAKVVSFKISLLKTKFSNDLDGKLEKSPLYNYQNFGGKFDKKILESFNDVISVTDEGKKQLFKMLKDAGIDITNLQIAYLIEDIKIELPDGTSNMLPPITFKITINSDEFDTEHSDVNSIKIEKSEKKPTTNTKDIGKYGIACEPFSDTEFSSIFTDISNRLGDEEENAFDKWNTYFPNDVLVQINISENNEIIKKISIEKFRKYQILVYYRVIEVLSVKRDLNGCIQEITINADSNY